MNHTTLEQVLASCQTRALARLQYQFRDLMLAEDVLQDANLAALTHWRRHGVPDQPLAWLMTTAKRRAIDRFRHDDTIRRHESALRLQQSQGLTDDSHDEDSNIPDDRLRFIFSCCHPALSDDVRVALTLTLFCQMTCRQVAQALLMKESTLAQRLVRAKRKMKLASIPCEIPERAQWPERLNAVLVVIYLIFNAGHLPESEQDPVDPHLCQQAIDLAGLLASLLPDEAEVLGLLALLLLTDSRRPARIDATGRMMSLQEQDRSLWDRQQIRAGQDIINRAILLRQPGPYQLQAAIADMHAQAASFEETDWFQISLLYQRLYRLQPSKVVALNGIMANANLVTADETLTQLSALAEQFDLSQFQPYHAALAKTQERAGQTESAGASYQLAIDLSQNAVEREFLQHRLDQLSI